MKRKSRDSGAFFGALQVVTVHPPLTPPTGGGGYFHPTCAPPPARGHFLPLSPLTPGGQGRRPGGGTDDYKRQMIFNGALHQKGRKSMKKDEFVVAICVPLFL